MPARNSSGDLLLGEGERVLLLGEGEGRFPLIQLCSACSLPSASDVISVNLALLAECKRVSAEAALSWEKSDRSVPGKRVQK